MSGVIDTLVEMGFPRNRVELAMSKSTSKDIEAVTEWLLTHEEEEVSTPAAPQVTPVEAPPEEAESKAELAALATSSQEPQSNSIRCDDCGKLFKNQTEVEYHAVKSGHENFSESTEVKRPLTEAEKKAQLDKIEAKLKQRRLEREEREKQEALERERKRIRSGKDLLEAKQRQQDLEMKKIVEARRREKEEDLLARQRVRDQIEADKAARRAKTAGGVPESPPVVSPPPAAASTTPKSAPNYNEVRLMIRLTDGELLTAAFGTKEPLSAVRCFIQMKTSDPTPFTLMTVAPRKVFTEEDYEKPLDVLDLGPAAVLVVQKTS